MAQDYNFTFAWESPYGHVVRMLERISPESGIVLDLGCGAGAIAEPLRERGHEYVGCDLDKRAVDALCARKFEGHQLDLSDSLALGDRVVSIVKGRRVAAVTLLDTIEHLPETSTFVAALRDTLVALDRPILVISVPNVAHFDVGAKLLTGRWDYTPTGLLDHTHVSFFTEKRLTDELGRCGFNEIARDDFSLTHSDQHFPADHPAFVDGAPLSILLWNLRSRADESGHVNQFVRAYAVSDLVRGAASETDPVQPFLTVLVRTQGRRVRNLVEALTCLAAQDDHDFEVLLLVHTTMGRIVDEMRTLLHEFDPSFVARVAVVHVASGGRVRPLNVGLEAARGRYLAFLDEDDHVTADWVSTFHEGADAHPGQIVRSVCVERRTESLVGKGYVTEWRTLSALRNTYGEEFDLLEHLNENRSPIHSFAMPLTAMRSLRMHFDESLPVVEDWDVLIRVASLTGVHDTKRRTSIYQRWDGGESSQVTVDQRVWSASRQVVLHRLDGLPLLLPPGSATRLADSAFGATAPPPPAGLTAEEAAPPPDVQEVLEERDRLRAELARAREELHRFAESEFWKATAPLRTAVGRARRVAGLARRVSRLGRRP